MCARWMRTWASARTWTPPRPTPTFRCRWGFRRISIGGGGVGGGAHTTQEWFRPEGRDLGLKRILLTLLLLMRGIRGSAPTGEPESEPPPRRRSGAVVQRRCLGRHLHLVKAAIAAMSRPFCSWPCASPWPRRRWLLRLPRDRACPGASWKGGRRRALWPGVFVFRICFSDQGLRFTTAPKSAFLTGLSSVTVPLLAALVYR